MELNVFTLFTVVIAIVAIITVSTYYIRNSNLCRQNLRLNLEKERVQKKAKFLKIKEEAVLRLETKLNNQLAQLDLDRENLAEHEARVDKHMEQCRELIDEKVIFINRIKAKLNIDSIEDWLDESNDKAIDYQTDLCETCVGCNDQPVHIVQECETYLHRNYADDNTKP